MVFDHFRHVGGIVKEQVIDAAFKVLQMRRHKYMPKYYGPALILDQAVFQPNDAVDVLFIFRLVGYHHNSLIELAVKLFK
jgi:hypothetical protein